MKHNNTIHIARVTSQVIIIEMAKFPEVGMIKTLGTDGQKNYIIFTYLFICLFIYLFVYLSLNWLGWNIVDRKKINDLRIEK